MITFSVAELKTIEALLGLSATSVMGFVSRNVWVKSQVAKAEGLLSKVKGEVDLHKTLAKEAVQFSEQAFAELDGNKKLDEACNFLASELGKFGIKTDQNTLNSYVQSALKVAKREFAEAWNEAPVEKPVIPQAVVPTSQAPVQQAVAPAESK